MEEKTTLKYFKKEKNEIRIFGEHFVKNNKEILQIEIELVEYYDNNEISNKTIEIILIGIEKLIDMSYMFYKCSSLLSLPDASKWDIFNVKKNEFYVFWMFITIIIAGYI